MKFIKDGQKWAQSKLLPGISGSTVSKYKVSCRKTRRIHKFDIDGQLVIDYSTTRITFQDKFYIFLEALMCIGYK